MKTLIILFMLFASTNAYAWPQGAATSIVGDTALPVDCSDRDVFVDTNATSGQRIYLCEQGTWVQQGGAGGGSGTVSSGTADTVAIYDSAGTTIVSSSVITDNNTNVGVSSTNPGQKLDVTGTVRASAFVSNAVTAGLVQLYEASANGSNYINWTSPSSLSTDVEYTLPSTLGTVGQIFTLSNSSGGINWSSVPTGSGVSGINTNYIPKAASSTSLNDSNIIQQGATNVGISTTGPQSLFAVGSTSQFQVNSSGAIAASTGITTSGGYTQSGTTANTFTGTPTFSNATYSGLFTGGNVGIGSATPGQKLDVVGTLRVIGTGNVGINSSNPGQQLDVVGTIRSSGFNSVGIGTTVPQQLCRKANGDFGYFNGAWASTCN